MNEEQIYKIAELIQIFAKDELFEQIAIVCYSDGERQEVEKLIKMVEELG